MHHNHTAFNYYLHQFLYFNNRRLIGNWHSTKEELTVKALEVHYATMAVKYMPDEFITAVCKPPPPAAHPFLRGPFSISTI